MSQDVKYLIFIQRKRFSCCLIALPEWGRCPGRGLAWVSRPPGNKPGSHEAAGAWTRTAPSPLVRAPPPVLHRSPSRPRPSTSPRSEVRRILIDRNLRGTNNQWLSDSSRGPPHRPPATGLCPFTRLVVVLWKTATFWIFPGETCGGSPPGSSAATGEAAGNRNTRFSFLPEHQPQPQQGPGSRALVFPTFSPAAAHLSAGPVVWQCSHYSQCSH